MRLIDEVIVVLYKYDKQLEQVCKSIQCINMAVLLGCVMLKVSLYKYYKRANTIDNGKNMSFN